jgi:predicted O-linked N-acetylglucosamine transferase (SPINDLY family)
VDLPDSNTKMFQEFATKWHDIRKLSYVEVAQLVRDEQITAFVDLSAHSSGNILPVFGIRPAPVQITYCGFPNTTGLKSIDYRITDDICEPSDAEKFHTEKLYKIDGCFLCFTIGDDLPDTNFEPLNDRPIIFGSFNNLSKMTDKTIKLWVEAVNSVANAKFAIKHKYLNDPVLRKLTLEKFEKHGLSADKIVIFEFGKSTNEHLEIYNKIDIALDSFPYNGTTTTCEALYMGVPVITILGDRHVSRVSASLLTAVGLPELVAKDENEFVEISAELARNIEKLTEIKKNLRNNMKNSILMNKKDFTGRFQNAILNMIDEVKKEGS